MVTSWGAKNKATDRQTEVILELKNVTTYNPSKTFLYEENRWERMSEGGTNSEGRSIEPIGVATDRWRKGTPGVDTTRVLKYSSVMHQF